MPTVEEVQQQIRELQAQALELAESLQATVVGYVANAAGTVADALPADRPELVSRGIDAAAHQAAFAKKVLDAEAAFGKSVIDAAVKPFAPARKRTVKAA